MRTIASPGWMLRIALRGLLALLLGASTGLALAANAKTAAAQVLVLGHQFPLGSIPDRAAQQFAQQVAKASQGKLVVQVHGAAAFGDEREHLALLKRQALDFSITGDLVISSLSDQYLVVNLPFMYRDAAHAMASYAGPLGQALRTELLERGLVALSWHHVGMRMLTANRPVYRLQDLKNLRLRLPQDTAWMAVWNALGAQPRQIQFTDLLPALAQDRVDAQENPPNFIRAARLFEHQRYIMTTQHMPQRQFFFASQGRWQKLSPVQRGWIQAAAKAASEQALTTANAENARDLQWLLSEGGMTLVPFDATGVAAIVATVPRALAGEQGEKVYQQILQTR